MLNNPESDCLSRGLVNKLAYSQKCNHLLGENYHVFEQGAVEEV
jgi:hypothetical protein